MAQIVNRSTPVELIASPAPIEEATRKTNTTPTAANQFVAVSENSSVPQQVSLTSTKHESRGFVKVKVDNDALCRYQPSGGVVKKIEKTVMPSHVDPQNQDKKAPRSRAKKDRKCFVQHNYHDHAFFSAEDVETMLQDDSYEGENQLLCSRKKRARHGPKGGVTIPFPLKLHEMLDKIEADGHGGIISWQPHGRCFLVHNPAKFVSTVMPTYFRQTKLTSFQRQLNLYGFSRLTSGLDKNGYYHELFLRGKPYLTRLMSRTRIKGTGTKAASSPSTEPDFYSMNRISPDGRPAVRVGASVPFSMRNGLRQLPMVVHSSYPPSAQAYRTKLEKVPSRSSAGSKSSEKISPSLSPSPSPIIRPEQRQNSSPAKSCPRSPAAVIVTPTPTKPPCMPIPSSLTSTNKRCTAIAPPPLFTKPVLEHNNHHSSSQHRSPTTAAMVTPTVKHQSAPCPVSPIALPPSIPQFKSNESYEAKPLQQREHTQQQLKNPTVHTLSSPTQTLKIQQPKEPQKKPTLLPSKDAGAAAVAIKIATTATQRKEDNSSPKLIKDEKQTNSGEPAEPNEEIMFEGKRFHYIDSLTECPSTIVPFDENEAPSTELFTPRSSDASSPYLVRQVSRVGEGQRRLSEDSLEDKSDTKMSSTVQGMDWYPQKASNDPISQRTHEISVQCKKELSTRSDEPQQNLTNGILTPSSSSSSLYDIVGYPDIPTSSIDDEDDLFDSAHEEEDDRDFGYFLEAMIQ